MLDKSEWTAALRAQGKAEPSRNEDIQGVWGKKPQKTFPSARFIESTPFTPLPR